jgi:drug/metabolite transporter (DMT)-like permease
MHRFKNWQLFAICVLTWGTTWFAITFQIGHVAPEVGVAMRFALAGIVILGLCGLRKERLRFTPPSTRCSRCRAASCTASYVCVYHAEQHLVSGLVAVGYSASPLVAGLGARALFGVNLRPRFILGGWLGIAGVALIFWPEFGEASGDRNTLLGALFTVGSVLLSTIGG